MKIKKKPVLSYQFTTYKAPKGVDPAYARSGFIHPLKTLNGHTLTQIQPKDHYHHYGIWNPWTQVLFENDTIDFWNIGGKQGTVRFAGFTEESKNSYSVLHEHVVLKNGKDKVALNEVQTLTINPLSENQYTIDFTLEYSCAADSPFKILKHRYAGFSLRATEEWNATNSEVISSEINTRDEIDGTTGKWCLVQGELGDDYGGVLLLSHPNNYNFPEPLRVWPEANHDGFIFINFAPTKTTDWLLQPKQTYILKYRLVVNSKKITREEADSLWDTYQETIK